MSVAAITAISLDCADPASLGRFYAELTGWPITSAADDAVYLGDGPIQLALQRVEDFQPAGWPDGDKQAHLDFSVPDVAAAEVRLVELGATKPEFQPGGSEWTVLLDPAGHPFCIAAG
ncbi:VOC family protein [Nocardioides sp. SYSU DS0651]|uniref:VOC family protein n=1 Tax=Nocardioides sp. SYSU DS0651 TaxID=3415955 RepID=UPI003F4C10E3